MTMVTTVGGRTLDLDLYTADDAGTWEVGLYVNNYDPTPLMNGSDITEASYGGYARQPTGGWSSAYVNASYQAQADAPSPLLFQPSSGSGLPQTIYGWFLQKGTTILHAEKLSSPVTFSSTSDTLTLFPSLKVGELA